MHHHVTVVDWLKDMCFYESNMYLGRFVDKDQHAERERDREREREREI